MNRTFLFLALLAAPAAFAQGMLLPTDTSLGPLGIKYQRVSVEIVDGSSIMQNQKFRRNTADGEFCLSIQLAP